MQHYSQQQAALAGLNLGNDSQAARRAIDLITRINEQQQLIQGDISYYLNALTNGTPTQARPVRRIMGSVRAGAGTGAGAAGRGGRRFGKSRRMKKKRQSGGRRPRYTMRRVKRRQTMRRRFRRRGSMRR